jgi:hypothetical protein
MVTPKCLLLTVLTGALMSRMVLAQVLCSTVICTPGTAPYTCTFPGTFSVNVSFTVGQVYTQPYSWSSYQYKQVANLQGYSGTGLCSVANVANMPMLSYTVNLIGSGTNYSTYTQSWTGTIGNWGIPLGSSIPGIVSTVNTFPPVNMSAYNCCS